QCRMKRCTAGGSFFLSVISVITEFTDGTSQMSRVLRPDISIRGDYLPEGDLDARHYTVGSTENASPAGRILSSSGPVGWFSTASTRADGGPWRQCAIISATTDAGPANTASTLPSRRLRTQPSSRLALARSSTQAR